MIMFVGLVTLAFRGRIDFVCRSKRAVAMPGEHFDLSSDPDRGRTNSSEPNSRRFVGITFACCSVYARAYINREGNAYLGHCPKCSRRVHLKIGPGGTDSRFFTAY